MILKGFFFLPVAPFPPWELWRLSVSRVWQNACTDTNTLNSGAVKRNKTEILTKPPKKYLQWQNLPDAFFPVQVWNVSFFFFSSFFGGGWGVCCFLYFTKMLKKSILLKFTNQNYIQNSFIQSKKHVNCHLKIQKCILYKLISSHFSRSIASAVKGCMLSVSVKATAHWLSGPSVEMRVTEQLEVTVMH